MNLDKIKDFFNKFSAHDLPTGAALLIGVMLLVLVFKAGKTLIKLAIFLIAAALFVGAYWWHHHR